MADFLERTQLRLAGTVWQSGCKRWYIDEDGRNFVIWPHFTRKYWLETRRLKLSDYRVTTRKEVVASASPDRLTTKA